MAKATVSVVGARRDVVGTHPREPKLLYRMREAPRWRQYNPTAGRCCRHQAEAVVIENPKALINRLLDLEEETKTDLQELPVLVSNNSSPWEVNHVVNVKTS